MQKFLTSTALAMALAAPMATTASAEMHGAHPMFGTATADSKTHEVMASSVIGARLYTAENGVADDEMGMNKDWNDVGEVHDIVLNKDGEIDYVIADIGGFLGIGEKQVAVSMNELKFVSDGEDSDEWFLVLPASKAQLDEAPTYDMGMANNMRETGAAMENSAMATDDAMQHDTVRMSGMTAEELTGKRVHDANGEWIGEVDKVLMSQDGNSAEKAVVDVGGFLGIGEKPVAVDLSDLMMKKEADGDDMQLYVNATKEQLEAMPTYQAD